MSTEFFLPIELRFVANDTGTISGYAALFNKADNHGDLVQPGAFTNTLAAHRSAGSRPQMLMAHNPNAIIGVWNALEEDDQGLKVTGRVVTTTTAGNDAYELLKAGAINGLSIGFNTVRSDRVPAGGRKVREVRLHEISIVGRPSQPLARVASVRHDQAAAAGLAAYIRQCGDRLRKN